MAAESTCGAAATATSITAPATNALSEWHAQLEPGKQTEFALLCAAAGAAMRPLLDGAPTSSAEAAFDGAVQCVAAFAHSRAAGWRQPWTDESLYTEANKERMVKQVGLVADLVGEIFDRAPHGKGIQREVLEQMVEMVMASDEKASLESMYLGIQMTSDDQRRKITERKLLFMLFCPILPTGVAAFELYVDCTSLELFSALLPDGKSTADVMDSRRESLITHLTCLRPDVWGGGGGGGGGAM